MFPVLQKTLKEPLQKVRTTSCPCDEQNMVDFVSINFYTKYNI